MKTLFSMAQSNRRRPLQLVTDNSVLVCRLGHVTITLYVADNGILNWDIQIQDLTSQVPFCECKASAILEVGIFDGDALLVDKGIEPKHVQIVAEVLNGDFVCKHPNQRARLKKLRPANATYPDIIPKPGETLEL